MPIVDICKTKLRFYDLVTAMEVFFIYESCAGKYEVLSEASISYLERRMNTLLKVKDDGPCDRACAFISCEPFLGCQVT